MGRLLSYFLSVTLLSFLVSALPSAAQAAPEVYWMKLQATDQYQRSALANQGISLEIFADDYVIALGTPAQRDSMEAQGLLITSYQFQPQMWDFPTQDANFHNYARTIAGLQALNKKFPGLTSLDTIGRTAEGRDIAHLRISTDAHNRAISGKPGIVFFGGHHAREHLSIEMPLMLAEYLLTEYAKGTPEIVKLINGRDIHIIPMVNPDGAEYDIASGEYQMWRKNRSDNHDGTFGTDLNRNYGFAWGTGGSSNDTSDETYMGTSAFSEQETQAVKRFLDAQNNITMLLTFHSFSELILYPWGHTYDPVPDNRDHLVFATMAKTMSQWNGYKPEQASALYIASGDTTDWAYGQHHIFGFTFELDPTDPFSGGGFYPGQAVIPAVFKKNIKPCLYMIDLADNPYRSIQSNGLNYGLNVMSLQE